MTLEYGHVYAIGEAVMQAMQTALAGVPLRANPDKAADLQDGVRLMVFKDSTDSQQDGNGNTNERVYTFQAGVIARTKDARKTAHADYWILKRAIRASITAMNSNGARITAQVKETDTTYQIENLDVGGCLILGSFSVQYREQNF